MITIKVGICRKEGDGNFGSYGATCEVEGIEIGAGTPPMEVAHIRDQWLVFCEATVAAELARQRGHAPAPVPAPAPARTNGHAQERGQWGDTADRGDAARRGGPVAPESGDCPKSGGGLYAWVKDQDEKYDLGLLKHINAWAKRQQLEGRMKDWEPGDIKKAWNEANRRIRAVRQAESDTDEVMRGN